MDNIKQWDTKYCEGWLYFKTGPWYYLHQARLCVVTLWLYYYKPHNPGKLVMEFFFFFNEMYFWSTDYLNNFFKVIFLVKTVLPWFEPEMINSKMSTSSIFQGCQYLARVGRDNTHSNCKNEIISESLLFLNHCWCQWLAPIPLCYL